MGSVELQKILLVDFDRRLVRVISDSLSDDDRDVLAANSRDALKKILSYEPDLILVSLPEAPVETVMDIMEENGREPHVIAVAENKTLLRRALAKGCCDYIQTPFEPFEVQHRTSLHLPEMRRSAKSKIHLGPAPSGSKRLNRKTESMGDLDQGRIYLVREPKPLLGFSIFRERVESGEKGLAFTRRNPRELRIELEESDPEIIWLTANISKHENCIDAKDIAKVTREIMHFLDGPDGGLIFIDGLEYLVSQTDFNTILRMLQFINDKIMISNDRILISLDPRAFSSQEISLIERECVVWE